MSPSSLIVAGLYGVSVAVVLLGVYVVVTGSIPRLLQASSAPQGTHQVRLDGLGLILLGTFMVTTALAVSQANAANRNIWVLLVWVLFSCGMLALRAASRRADRASAAETFGKR